MLALRIRLATLSEIQKTTSLSLLSVPYISTVHTVGSISSKVISHCNFPLIIPQDPIFRG